MNYVKICEDVPGAHIVTCTGGAFTMTGFDQACATMEGKKASLGCVVVHDMDVFGDLKDRFSGGRLVWNPTRIDSWNGDRDKLGRRVWETRMTPKRIFSVRVVEGMPKNVVLLMPKKGKKVTAKVVISS